MMRPQVSWYVCLMADLPIVAKSIVDGESDRGNGGNGGSGRGSEVGVGLEVPRAMHNGLLLGIAKDRFFAFFM